MPVPDGGESSLSPTEAFGVLGNETRMEILQTLGDAGGPLPFSELYDGVDIDDSGHFNYHLDKLVGHFVRKTDDGYELQQAGVRIVEAVLSGAITEMPRLEPTPIDGPCPYCGGVIELSYRDERVLQRCRECLGEVHEDSPLPIGTLERGYLPPAGIKGRSPRETLLARNTWSVIERVAMANGVCPRCSGQVEHSVSVCDDHDGEGICSACGRRHAIRIDSRCLNCPHERGGLILRILLGDSAFRAFFETRGVDVFASGPEAGAHFANYEERIVSTDPFEGTINFTLEGDELSLTVNSDLSVTHVEVS